jgi:hypothetical protein
MRHHRWLQASERRRQSHRPQRSATSNRHNSLRKGLPRSLRCDRKKSDHNADRVSWTSPDSPEILPNCSLPHVSYIAYSNLPFFGGRRKKTWGRRERILDLRVWILDFLTRDPYLFLGCAPKKSFVFRWVAPAFGRLPGPSRRSRLPQGARGEGVRKRQRRRLRGARHPRSPPSSDFFCLHPKKVPLF